MDKKNITIIFLSIALLASMYFTYSNGETLESEKIKENDLNPRKTLISAYKKFQQHPPMLNAEMILCTQISRFFLDYGIDNGTYFRCDEKGCDPYPVKVHNSGAYTQFIPLGGQAMLFKVVTDNALDNKGEFMDMATIGTTVLISTGKCEIKATLNIKI
jgi:hypothetical protein